MIQRKMLTALYGIMASGYKTSKSALEARDKLLKKLAKDKFYEHTLTMVAIEVVE